MKKTATAERVGVIYARYSSHNQRDESIEQQIDECTAYANANNITLLRVYDDHAISGRTDARSAFQRMMRDAENRQFTVVIAYKSNRISRNMMQALIYEEKLAKFGIDLMYAKEEFGNNPAGRFALRSMMNVNQFYSENLAEDVIRGMMDNAENSLPNGPLPIGYKRGDDGRIALDSPCDGYIRMIFEMYAGGTSITEISKHLNSIGARTRSGRPFGKGSFHRILHNKRYTGRYIYNGIDTPDAIPRIVSDEIYERAQAMLAIHAHHPQKSRAEKEYLLSGKAFCRVCGAPITGVSGTGHTGALYRYYRFTCGSHSCRQKNIVQDRLEDFIVSATREYILAPGVIDFISEQCADASRAIFEKNDELHALESQLAGVNQSLSGIMAAIEAGVITRTTKSRLDELEHNQDVLRAKISSVSSRRRILEKRDVKYVLSKFANEPVGTRKYNESILGGFVNRIEIDSDSIVVYYNIMRNGNALDSKRYNFNPHSPEGGSSDSNGYPGEIDHNGVEEGSSIDPHGSPYIAINEHAYTNGTFVVLVLPLCTVKGK